MELKAENVFTVTEELFREGMGELMNDEYMPAAKKMLIAMAVIWLVLALITLKLGGRIVLVVIELAVIAAAGVWMVAVSPKKRINRAWEMTKGREGGTDRRTCFYEDRLEVEQGNLIVNYEDVARTIETENLLILISREGVGVMAAKDGFKKGDVQTVMALLEEWKR